MFFLAHAGHWIESVVFGVPVLILAAWMLVDRFRTQRRERRRQLGSDRAPTTCTEIRAEKHSRPSRPPSTTEKNPPR